MVKVWKYLVATNRLAAVYIFARLNGKFYPKSVLKTKVAIFQISPGFKKNFSLLLKKRAQKHPFERVPTPYQVYSWMAPQPEHQVDYIRAEDGG